MALLRTPKKSSFPMGDQQQKCRSPFGLYTDSDMLAWLKGLALDPCDRKASPDSARQLLKQSLKVRKLLVLGNDDSPRRKRKLGQFLKGSKFLVASGLATREPDAQSSKRMDRGHSVSGLTNRNSNNEVLKPQLVWDSRGSGSVLTFENEYQGNQVYIDLTTLDDMENYGSSIKDITASCIVETDESNNGLNTSSLENLKFGDATIVNANNAGNFKDTAGSSDSFSLDDDSSQLESRFRILDLPRPIPVRDTDGSCHHSDSLRSYEQNLKRQEALRVLRLDKYPRNSVVPVGPGFQADLPEWTGPVSRETLYGDSEVLKRLGTQTWPIKGRSVGTTVNAIEKGRSSSCSCISPGSISCVKHHVNEARVLVQSELGPAFQRWKFDEMGESVSKSWTSSEQRTFDSLLEKYKKQDQASFWKTVFKRFPSKCPKSIMNYYYNVFIPRRMSLETRASSDEINSDDDEINREEVQS